MTPGTPSYKTPTEVKVAILAVALVGMVLQIGQLALVFFVLPNSDFPLPWNFTDKIEITYENRTDQTVYLYIEDRLESTIRAHDSVRVSDWKFIWWFGQRIQVRDAPSGRILFAAKLDKDDLEERAYRIVIEDP
jgi:hypothetical protein